MDCTLLACCSNLWVVKLLLDHPDIDPNFVAADGYPVLMRVLHNPGAVRLLLDHPDIDVNRQNDSGRTALCQVVSRNHLEAAKLLLEREDIDINRPDNRGYTALFWACNNNCLEMVNLLLGETILTSTLRPLIAVAPRWPTPIVLVAA